MQSTLEYDLQDFTKVMNVNVIGMFTVLQSVAKRMIAAAGGKDNHKAICTCTVEETTTKGGEEETTNTTYGCDMDSIADHGNDIKKKFISSEIKNNFAIVNTASVAALRGTPT